MRRMDPKKETWFTAGGLLLGLLLGMAVIYIAKGEIDFGGFFGGIAGVMIVLAFRLWKQHRKKDITPEYDERVEKNIRKFHSTVGFIFFLLIVLTLIILTILNISSVDIAYIWMVIVLYIVITGFGTMIVKNR